LPVTAAIPEEALASFVAEEAGEDLAQARTVSVRQGQLQDRLGEWFRELDVSPPVEWPNGRREVVVFVIEYETVTSRFAIPSKRAPCTNDGVTFSDPSSSWPIPRAAEWILSARVVHYRGVTVDSGMKAS
jgi:hypothetical protein